MTRVLSTACKRTQRGTCVTWRMSTACKRTQAGTCVTRRVLSACKNIQGLAGMPRCPLPAHHYGETGGRWSPLPAKALRCDTMSSACKSTQGKRCEQVWHNVLCLQSVHLGKTGVTRCLLPAKALKQTENKKKVWHDILCLQKFSGDTGVARPSSAWKSTPGKQVWHNVFFAGAKRALRRNRCDMFSSACKACSLGKQVWHDDLCLHITQGKQVWHVLCLQSVHSAKTGVTLSSLHAKRVLRGTGMTRCSVSAKHSGMNRCDTMFPACKTLRKEQVWHHVFCMQNTQEGTCVTPCFLPAKHSGRNRCDTMFSACKTLRKE